MNDNAPTLVLIAAVVDPRDEYVRRLRSLIDCGPSRVRLITNFDVRMPRVLQQAQALVAVVVPSLVEPFGLVAAEVLADTIVWLATLPADGPTGAFFRDRQPISW